MDIGTRTTERDKQMKTGLSREIQQDRQTGISSPRVDSSVIGFTGSTIFADSGTPFAVANGWAADRDVEVRGSADNDGRYHIVTRADATLTVERALKTEASGPAIQLRMV